MCIQQHADIIQNDTEVPDAHHTRYYVFILCIYTADATLIFEVELLKIERKEEL